MEQVSDDLAAALLYLFKLRGEIWLLLMLVVWGPHARKDFDKAL